MLHKSMAVCLKPQALGFDASKFGMVEPKGSAMQFCRRVELPRGSISTTIKRLAQKGHPCSWCCSSESAGKFCVRSRMWMYLSAIPGRLTGGKNTWPCATF